MSEQTGSSLKSSSSDGDAMFSPAILKYEQKLESNLLFEEEKLRMQEEGGE